MSDSKYAALKQIPIDQLYVGMSVSCEKVITVEMVESFAMLSGDHNPVHLDEDYAANSRYRRRIAHGLMSASFFSGLFGTELPGQGCVYAAQSLRFKRPVYIGDTVEAKVVITSVDASRKRVGFDTICLVKNKVVVDGNAEIFMP